MDDRQAGKRKLLCRVSGTPATIIDQVFIQMLQSSGKTYSPGNLRDQLSIELPEGSRCQVEWDASNAVVTDTATDTVSAVDISLISLEEEAIFEGPGGFGLSTDIFANNDDAEVHHEYKIDTTEDNVEDETNMEKSDDNGDAYDNVDAFDYNNNEEGHTTNEENEDEAWTSDDTKRKYAPFIQRTFCKSDPVSRKIVKKYMRRLFHDILIPHNLLYLPTGKLSQAGKLVEPKIQKHSSGVYGIVFTGEDGSEELAVCGESNNILQRMEQRMKDENLLEKAKGRKIRFVFMHDINHWTPIASQDMTKLYNDMMNELCTAEGMRVSVRRLWIRIFQQGGQKLGIEKCMWRMLVEHSIKTEYNLNLEWEFLWDDPECEDRAYAEATRLRTKMVGHVEPIIAAHQADPEKGYFLSFDSWVPCGDWMSTKVMGSNAITTMHVDSIDVPAIPHAKTAEERFNVSQYTPAQRMYGQSKLQMVLATLLYHPYGILYLDSNKVLFQQNPGGVFFSVHDILRWFGFELQEALNMGHMFLYTKEGLHAVVVHGPWCICGDARTVISMAYRARATLSLAACVNTTRLFLGMEDLSAADWWKNPIDGMFSFQKACFNFHMAGPIHCRIPSAFYKACVGGPNNRALTNNCLNKGAEDDPIANNLRWYHKNGFKSHTQSSLGCRMVRNYLSTLRTETIDKTIGFHLMDILRYRPDASEGTTPEFFQFRFDALLRDHIADANLQAELRPIQVSYVAANPEITQPKCSVENCTNFIVNGGLCVKHGAKKKKCNVQNCTTFAVNRGLCFKHGAKKKMCKVENCTSFVQNGGLCIKHGAKKKTCNVQNCTTFAVNRGLCFKHGAKKKMCKVENCTSQAVQAGLCTKHGAKRKNTRKMCSVDGCDKQGRFSGMCKKHFNHFNLVDEDESTVTCEVIVEEIKKLDLSGK